MGKSRYLCQEIAFLFVSLVGLTLFPEASFGNSDQWLRVIELERNTIVKLECADGRVLGGRFIFYKEKFSHYVVAVEYRFVGEQAPGGPAWATRNSLIIELTSFT